ncbi:MAG: D-2-hydroxyacid dehydrogenase [Oscillospiraceae bacterium]
MKIVILDRKTLTNDDISFAEIEALGDVVSYSSTPNELIVERICDADVVLCNKSPITKEVISACKNLKYIGLFATGYNNIDIKAASERGIVVSNAGEYSTMAVAQHVFALILEHYSKVSGYSSSVKNGDWERSDTFSYFLSPTYEILGQTIGIIGFGSIGKAVAKVADAFGMKVIISTRTLPPKGLFPYEFVSRDEVFARADILTLHCPLTELTAGLINAENLAKMKKTALLINTSRGGTIIEQELADALNSGVIAGAGIDVLTNEPMKNSPLKTAKSCVITPHIAWSPRQTRERLITIVAKNLGAFISGKPINVVNK